MRREHRRELKHDRFVDEVGTWSSRARDNQRLLLLVAVAVVALAIAAYGTLFYRSTREQRAQEALSTAIETIDSPLMPPGHGFGLGFAVRTHRGIAPFPGSLRQFFWSGMAGTFFFIDPVEDLLTVFMMQGPGQREYIRNMLRDLVYTAVE